MVFIYNKGNWEGIMENVILALLIVTLVLALGGLVLCIITLIKTSKANQKEGEVTFDTKELEKNQVQATTEIKAAVENIEKSISLRLEGQMNEKLGEQNARIIQNMKAQSETDFVRMNDFQTKISNTLNQQVATMNETVNKNVKTMNESNLATMKNVQDSMNGLVESNTKRLNDFQKTIQDNLNSQIKTMNEKIDSSLKTINDKVNQSLTEGFKGTSESMVSLQKSLGMVQEAQKNIDSLQTDINSLKGILTNNQERGRYGEFQLERLLDNLFGGLKGTLYDTQYVLKEAKDGEPALRPDAVVFLDGESKHQIICIDSKFSLTGYEDLFDPSKRLEEKDVNVAKASFRLALKQRIDETSKYIIKGTTISNALMFIPNDGIFAFIHNTYPDLIEEAEKKNVVLVSPTILQPLLASFRVIQIDAKKSKNLAAINESLNRLGDEFKRFIPRWKNLSKSVETMANKTREFDTTVNKIGNRFDKVAKIELQKDDEEENTGDYAAIEHRDATEGE